jgi:hypothetical protein
MHQCRGIKRNGGQCTQTVEPSNAYCYLHDPANAAQRRRAASKAGSSKPSREIQQMKEELRRIKDDVLADSVEPKAGAVAVQVYRVLKDLIELERRIKETDQLSAEIEELRREVMG